MATGSGNLDDEVQIGINGNVNVDGVKKAGTDIDQLTAKIGKLDTALGNVNKTAELLSSILSEINKKTSIKIDNISGNQIKIQSGRSSVRYDPDNPNAVKSAQASQERIDRLLSQEERIYAEKVRKAQIENDNYDKLIDLQEKEIRARQTYATARLSSANFKNSQENLRNLNANSAQREALLGFYRYKGEHPDQFASTRNLYSYQIGRGISTIGNSLSSKGDIGKIVGGTLLIVGSSLISPAIAARAAIVELGKGLSDFTASAVQSYSEIEAIKTNLSVVYSSQSQANSAFTNLSEYAVKSPFGVQQTSELAILLKQSGVYASDLMNTLKMLGDTAGGNMEKMKRIANNYAQIVSIGKASMLDMRQFAYAGIPIFEAVSKELGVSQQELRKLISDGKVTSDIIEKVFKDLTGVNGIFENATQKGAETLKARLQNLKDAKQLMMAEFGEFGVNLGSTYGKDSYIKNGVSLVENIYQGLNKWVEGKNLIRTIESVDKNKAEQERLQDLIDRARAYGDEDTAKILEKSLIKIKNIYSPEEIRSIYAESYKQYGYYADKYTSELSGYDYWNNPLSAKRMYNKYNNKYTVLSDLQNYMTNNPDWINSNSLSMINGYNPSSLRKELYFNALAMGITGEELSDYTLLMARYVDEIQKERDKYGEYRDIAMNPANAEMRKSYYETISELGQTEISDFLDRNTRVVGNLGQGVVPSIFNTISEIKNEYEQTEARKLAIEEDRKNIFKSAQKEIEEIADFMDEDNFINVQSVSSEKLLNYIKDGAIWKGSSLATNMDNPQKAEEDRKFLIEQIKYYGNAIEKLTDETSFEKSYKSIFGNMSNLNYASIPTEKLMDMFNEYFAKSQDLFEEKVLSGTESEKKVANQALVLLKLITVRLQSDKGILGINIDDLFTGKKGDVYTPLWKRIISSATGVSTNAITGTKQALDFYNDNLVARKNIGSTLSALAQNGLSVDVIQSLTSSRIGKTTDGTWQIDWKATRDVVGDFAKSISASTIAIDTWTKGLEEEYNTYANLIGDGILAPETDNVKQAMYISAKKVDQSWLSEGEQGINAFGEKLVNGLGEEVVKIVDGVAYGKNSKGEFYQLQDQNLKITGTIYEEIKKRLPEIEKELRETRLIQAKNQVLNKMTSDTFGGVISGRGMSRRNEITEFWTEFNDQAMTILRSQISSEKLQEYGFGTYEDAQAAYLRKDSDALTMFNLALEDTNRIISAFVNSPEYAELKKTYDNKEHQSEINSAWSVFSSIASGGTPFAGYGASTNPYEQNGMAGFRHRLFGGSIMESVGLNGVSIRDLSVMAKQMKLSEDLLAMNDKEADAWVAKQIAIEAVNKSLKDMSNSLMDIAKNTSKQMFLSPFETIGENLVGYVKNGEKFTDYLKDAGQAMRGIAGQMISNMGAEMATAGFRIAAAAAMSNQWGKVAAGLALAGAGGFASGFGNYLQSAKEDSDDDKVAKLESLEEKLADLLQQARTDALYYENNLRHKTALGHNEKFNYQSVNDAVIAPGGKVISTSPEDYLIATKTPQTLGSAAPIINNKIINNAGVKVRQEQSVNPDGSIDITTYLENVMDNYITSGRGDEAFEIMNMRKAGRRGIM